jgi:hypothetical protein
MIKLLQIRMNMVGRTFSRNWQMKLFKRLFSVESLKVFWQNETNPVD